MRFEDVFGHSDKCKQVTKVASKNDSVSMEWSHTFFEKKNILFAL